MQFAKYSDKGFDKKVNVIVELKYYRFDLK